MDVTTDEQTGSGKTYTINGSSEGGAQHLGLTPRAVKELFRALNRDSNKFSFAVHCYMMELYQDHLVDLLLPEKTETRPKLDIKKDTKGWVTVQNSTTVVVNSAAELQVRFSNPIPNPSPNHNPTLTLTLTLR